MPTLKLSERGIAAMKFATLEREHAIANPLRKTDPTQLEVWDELVPGLGIRLTNRGVKAWFVRYRANGSNRRMTLGRYPTLSLAKARDRARAVLADAGAGKDPALERRERRANDTTFGALAREVLDAKAAAGTRGSTQREREQVLRAELLPAWRNRPASSITRRDVALLVERIGRRAPVHAGKVLAVVRLIYNEGLRRGFPGIESNPAHLLQPAKRPGVRNRFLTMDEIKTVWKVLEREALITRCFFRFALLTAQRYGAVRAIRWTDIEDGDVWRTPAPVFKGKRDHLTPLSAEALAVLDEVRMLTGDGEYVFPSRRGGPRNSIRTALTRIQERSKLSRWTLHDFRRTFRTHAVRATEDGGLAIPPSVADAVLGHREASLGFDRYTAEPERYLLHEKRDALAKWGRCVRGAVS